MGKRMLRNWKRPGTWRGRGGQEGGGWGGETATVRGRLGGDNREVGNGDREMGRGATGRGRLRGEEGARGGRISQTDMMECLGGHRL